jgi:hypothetical protein
VSNFESNPLEMIMDKLQICVNIDSKNLMELKSMSDQAGLIPKNPTEQLLYSTIKITGQLNNQHTSYGTGFFFRYPINESTNCIVILTNKHVVKDLQDISFCFHDSINSNGTAIPSQNSFTLSLTNNDLQALWVPHPDSEVDLGAIVFFPILQAIESTLKKVPYYICLDQSLIQTDDILKDNVGVAEKILMIGYPQGLSDETNNFPIIRQGISATHPSLDFNSKPIGVADIACFPGSSGSPILYCPEIRYTSGGGIAMGPPAYILLGLLCAGPVHTSEGRIEIKEVPTSINNLVTLNTQMMHLGYYVKAKEILTLWGSIKSKFTIENS